MVSSNLIDLAHRFMTSTTAFHRYLVLQAMLYFVTKLVVFLAYRKQAGAQIERTTMTAYGFANLVLVIVLGMYFFLF